MWQRLSSNAEIIKHTKHIKYQFGRIADKGIYDEASDDYPDAVKNLGGRAVMDLQQWAYLEGISECLLVCCSDTLTDPKNNAEAYHLFKEKHRRTKPPR